jgi:hypothetical protein
MNYDRCEGVIDLIQGQTAATASAARAEAAVKAAEGFARLQNKRHTLALNACLAKTFDVSVLPSPVAKLV